MGKYEYSPDVLIQNAWSGSSELVWLLLAAVLVFCCIATRIISGFQSRVDSKTEQPQSVKTLPYWFPWLGHSLSFIWDHVSFTEKTRSVSLSTTELALCDLIGAIEII